MSETHGRKYYASKTYVNEKISDNIDPTLSIEGKSADAKAVGNAILNPRLYTAYIDQVNGYTYYVGMRNGSWTSRCAIERLEIAAMPSRTEYVVDDIFDTTGLIV